MKKRGREVFGTAGLLRGRRLNTHLKFPVILNISSAKTNSVAFTSGSTVALRKSTACVALYASVTLNSKSPSGVVASSSSGKVVSELFVVVVVVVDAVESVCVAVTGVTGTKYLLGVALKMFTYKKSHK